MTTINEDTVRKLARSARDSDDAIVVGSRAGIIEWANDAWTRVTGYPLDASVSKPVSAFLEGVDVAPAVVEFVADCFNRGEVCEVEIPVTTPAQRNLWIRLRVEPLLDAAGEPSDFVATATDVTAQKRIETEPTLDLLDLSLLARRVMGRQRSLLGPTVGLDCELAPDLPHVLGDPVLLEALLERGACRANENIGEGWGTLTFWTGILGASAGPLFGEDLRDLRASGHWVFLELHDTGAAASSPLTRRVSEPFLSTSHARHAMTWSTAERRVAALGGQLRIETSLAYGTSLLFLFPFAS